MIVGVDEVGRGPLAGAVVACALCVNEKVPLPVKDSKGLSSRQRELFFDCFKSKTVFSLGLATEEEIDRHNILEATFIAFNRAIESLINKAPRLKNAMFIIDGTLFKTNLRIKHRCLVGADKSVREVAYASIVAKLFRDYLMGVADFCFPQWDFFKHKGYPTARHLQLIKKHDISPLHRKSFSPCQAGIKGRGNRR